MNRIAALLILPFLAAVACADMGPVYITTDNATAPASASADCSGEPDSSTGEVGADSTGGSRICTGIDVAPTCEPSGDFCADVNALCLEIGLDLSDVDPPGTDYCAIYAANCEDADPCFRCWEIENLCWQVAPSGVAADCAGVAGRCACLID